MNRGRRQGSVEAVIITCVLRASIKIWLLLWWFLIILKDNFLDMNSDENFDRTGIVCSTSHARELLYAFSCFADENLASSYIKTLTFATAMGFLFYTYSLRAWSPSVLNLLLFYKQEYEKKIRSKNRKQTLPSYHMNFALHPVNFPSTCIYTSRFYSANNSTFLARTLFPFIPVDIIIIRLSLARISNIEYQISHSCLGTHARARNCMYALSVRYIICIIYI